MRPMTPTLLRLRAVLAPLWLLAAGGLASAEPASPQPTLPQAPASAIPLTSPILGGAAGGKAEPLTIRKPSRRVATRTHRLHAHREIEAAAIDRPALAGVALVQPLPHPIQPPHATVPVPAYPFENAVSFYTAPPPPVVCHHAPRDPEAPSAGLAYEQAVICAADNP